METIGTFKQIQKNVLFGRPDLSERTDFKCPTGCFCASRDMFYGRMGCAFWEMSYGRFCASRIYRRNGDDREVDVIFQQLGYFKLQNSVELADTCSRQLYLQVLSAHIQEWDMVPQSTC